MHGKILKGISGFYYVHVVESGIYECKAKGIFRKEGVKPLVGDLVEIDVIDEEQKKGISPFFIIDLLFFSQISCSYCISIINHFFWCPCEYNFTSLLFHDQYTPSS